MNTVPRPTDVGPLEVLDRVCAVRNGCDAILEGRFDPTADMLGALITILTKAMLWQAGQPPEDAERLSHLLARLGLIPR